MEEGKGNRLPDITLSSIMTIAKNGATKGAAGSLAAWGAINLGIWYFLGSENRAILGRLPNPSNELQFLIYGSAFIGLVMLSFAAVAALTKAAFTIIMDGLSLVGVGAWNIFHDFFALSALRPYGYTIEKPSTLWIILGICQLVWGFRQFKHYARVSSWTGAVSNPEETEDVRKYLLSINKGAENYENKRITASTTIKGPLGIGFFDTTISYFGWFAGEHLLLMSKQMNDFLLIERKAASAATYGKGIMDVMTDKGKLSLSLGGLSVLTIKEWTGKTITPLDIRYLAEQKKVTITILRPFLHSADSGMREAACTALSSIDDSNSGDVLLRYLDDSDAIVRAAALAACKKMKISSVQDKAIQLLADPSDDVRKIAADYLKYFPTPSTVPLLERYLSSEQSEIVRKGLQQALKSAKKGG